MNTKEFYFTEWVVEVKTNRNTEVCHFDTYGEAASYAMEQTTVKESELPCKLIIMTQSNTIK